MKSKEASKILDVSATATRSQQQQNQKQQVQTSIATCQEHPVATTTNKWKHTAATLLKQAIEQVRAAAATLFKAAHLNNYNTNNSTQTARKQQIANS